MKNIIFCFIVGSSILVQGVKAQLLSTSNESSQTTSRSPIPSGPSVYGVFVGRTPCQELMTDLNVEINIECAKRKMGLTLYHDPVTHASTTYETRGMAKWTGKGKWHILRGTPNDPQATVFQLELDANTFMYLLKGDENVFFILDRNKNFLIGNDKYSYTLNRARL